MDARGGRIPFLLGGWRSFAASNYFSLYFEKEFFEAWFLNLGLFLACFVKGLF
jgi:hypothetical protein